METKVLLDLKSGRDGIIIIILSKARSSFRKFKIHRIYICYNCIVIQEIENLQFHLQQRTIFTMLDENHISIVKDNDIYVRNLQSIKSQQLAQLNNAHQDLTVLRPLDERLNTDMHPSKIIQNKSQHNFYRYGWMQEVEPTSASNIAAFATLVFFVAAIGYLLAGTKLLKFIQFFLTKKQY